METCIIIGASVASSLSAYVLSPFFKKIIILEKSNTLCEYRPALQQGTQFHVFLAKGQQVLKSLIPGVEKDFNDSGFPVAALPTDMKWRSEFGDLVPSENKICDIHLMDRMDLEKVLISRLSDKDNIEFHLGCEVTDIKITDGVCQRVRYKGNGVESEINSDFVVVGGGRNFPLAELLEARGLNVPTPKRVPAQFMYLSQIRKLKSGSVPWKTFYEQAAPPHSFKGAIIGKVREPDEFMFMMGGMDGHFPKLGKELEFLSQLKGNEFTRFYKNSSPVTKAQAYRINGSCHYPYGKMKRAWPRNLVALGDSVCAFNPVYGQGLTVAALGAEALKRHFEDNKNPGATTFKFQRSIDKIIKVPWLLGTSEDKKYNGNPPKGLDGLVNRYVKALNRGSVQDPELGRAFAKVIHMLEGPASLFKPQIMWRVFKTSLAFHLGKKQASKFQVGQLNG